MEEVERTTGRTNLTALSTVVPELPRATAVSEEEASLGMGIGASVFVIFGGRSGVAPWMNKPDIFDTGVNTVGFTVGSGLNTAPAAPTTMRLSKMARLRRLLAVLRNGFFAAECMVVVVDGCFFSMLVSPFFLSFFSP